MDYISIYLQTKSKGVDAEIKSIGISDGKTSDVFRDPLEIVSRVHQLIEQNGSVVDPAIIVNASDITTRLFKRFGIYEALKKFQIIGVLETAHRQYREGKLPLPNSENGKRLNGLDQVHVALKDLGYRPSGRGTFNKPAAHSKYLIDLIGCLKSNQVASSGLSYGT